jgi:hypothetical protein
LNKAILARQPAPLQQFSALKSNIFPPLGNPVKTSRIREKYPLTIGKNYLHEAQVFVLLLTLAGLFYPVSALPDQS